VISVVAVNRVAHVILSQPSSRVDARSNVGILDAARNRFALGCVLKPAWDELSARHLTGKMPVPHGAFGYSHAARARPGRRGRGYPSSVVVLLPIGRPVDSGRRTMVFRRRKERPPSRSALLAARVVRHPQVTERPTADGGLELAVPVARRRLARWLSRSGDRPVIRRFELDALGVETWRMMDGRTTVRGMIERLASAHQLNLREAEVAMLAYLRKLMERGIMALAWPEHEQTGKRETRT
jgi:hypothetical protein